MQSRFAESRDRARKVLPDPGTKSTLAGGPGPILALTGEAGSAYKYIMSLLPRAIQLGLVWLTATTVPVAGLPFFYCLCPDGHGKVFCRGPSAQAQGCCCGARDLAPAKDGRCCRARESTYALKARRSCCQGHRRPIDSAADGQVQPRGCQRTLVHVEFVAPTPAGHPPALDPAAGLALPLTDLSCSSPMPRMCNAQLSWQSYRIPPPTDLVIVLQQLLI
jgi:hypothetical protein